MKQNSHSAISALLPTFHRMQSFQSLSADLIAQSFALDPHASYPTATSRRRLTVIKLQDNVTVCKVIQVKLAIVKMEFIIATLRLLFAAVVEEQGGIVGALAKALASRSAQIQGSDNDSDESDIDDDDDEWDD